LFQACCILLVFIACSPDTVPLEGLENPERTAPLDASMSSTLDGMVSAPADAAPLPASDATVQADAQVALHQDGGRVDIDAGEASDAGQDPSNDSGATVGDSGLVVDVDAAENSADAAPPPPVECVGPGPDEAGAQAPHPDGTCMTCEGAPKPVWRMSDFQPLSCGFESTYGLAPFDGRATLVALFNAGCGYCRNQAQNMERMRLELRVAGIDAHFVAVNGLRYVAHQAGLAERCSFPIFQDTEDILGIDEMQGAIYDMYVYRPDGGLHVFLSGFDGPDTTLSEAEGYANVRQAVVSAAQGIEYVAPFPPVEIDAPDAGEP